MENKKVTYNLDAELHQYLRLAAATERREMVELVEEALKSYFGWHRMTETENRELKTYELVEFRGKGQSANVDFTSYSRDLGCTGSEQGIAEDLLGFMEEQGRLLVRVFDGREYKALRSFPDAGCLYINGGEMQIKVTIPGRIRYEQLRQRHVAETAQATLGVMPPPGEALGPLVAQLKKLIEQPSHPLKLHDFLSPIVEEARAKIDASPILNFGAHPSQQALSERVAIVDEAISKLIPLLIIGCYWADVSQAKVLGKALLRMVIAHTPQGSFYSFWENVARYPALRVVYAAGIAACANDSFDVLRFLLLDLKSRRRPDQPELQMIRVLHDGCEFYHDHWQWLPGMERHHVPISDYLLQSLRVPLGEISTSDEDLSEKFTRFELFQSLIYEDVAQGESFWAPSGTFTYRSADVLGQMKKEVEQCGKTWKPLQAGLFSGSPDRAIELMTKLGEFTNRVRLQRGIWV